MTKNFKITLDLATFSAGDVERVTGVSAVLQREWRRRGFLPETAPGQKARFNLFTMAELLVMQRLAEHGVGPASSVSVANMWGAVVAEHVLRDPVAYGGQFTDFMRSVPLKQLTFDPAFDYGAPTQRGEIKERKTLALVEGVPGEMEETGIPELADYRVEWIERIDTPAGRAEWLAYRSLPMKGGLMYLGPERYLLWWHSNHFGRAVSLDRAFEREAQKSVHGSDSAFVLDASAVARTLLHRAGKPLVSIQIEEGNAP